MHRKVLVTLVLLLVAFTNCASAGEMAYGLIAKKSFIAFECSHLAALARDQKELERLFILGVESGRVYLSARQAGKLTEKNNASAPIAWGLHGQGPSADFILGRIYEVASEEAREETKPLGDSTDFASPARNAFNAMNCALVK